MLFIWQLFWHQIHPLQVFIPHSSTYAHHMTTNTCHSLWPNLIMCGMCIGTYSCKPNRKNVSREQHLVKLGSVLLTPALLWNRRNKRYHTYLRDNNHNNYGRHLQRCMCALPHCVLFMEHLNCTCSEKCSQSSKTIIEFGPNKRVYSWSHSGLFDLIT